MRVVIAGGHGQIALHIARQLAERGDQAVGIIRNTDHIVDLRDVSAEPAVLDLENSTVDEVAALLADADAAIFAAGAGPGSGPARKETVDKGAAVLFAQAAVEAGVRRHLQISAMGVDQPHNTGQDETFRVYLDAKKEAENDLRARDLAWTIVRPGRLTNEPGTDLVHLAESAESGEISRETVAKVIVALLDEPRSFEKTLELVNGHTPISEALERI